MEFIIVKLESLISDRKDDIKSILPEDFFFLLFRMFFQDRLRGDLKHPFGIRNASGLVQFICDVTIMGVISKVSTHLTPVRLI
jgi:hypothetical protein